MEELGGVARGAVVEETAEALGDEQDGQCEHRGGQTTPRQFDEQDDPGGDVRQRTPGVDILFEEPVVAPLAVARLGAGRVRHGRRDQIVVGLEIPVLHASRKVSRRRFTSANWATMPAIASPR